MTCVVIGRILQLVCDSDMIDLVTGLVISFATVVFPCGVI